MSVSALITHANKGGERSLRKLEMRLLDAGVTVTRTDDNLVRYHNKVLIVDRNLLLVLSCNFTHLDLDHSRGFGIVTRKKKLVPGCAQATCRRQRPRSYHAGLDSFVVSPANARKQLVGLIQRAKKELLIYDPKIADVGMLRALTERVKHGVDVRIVGTVGRGSHNLNVRPLSGLRLPCPSNRPRPSGGISWVVRACGRPSWIRGARFV